MFPLSALSSPGSKCPSNALRAQVPERLECISVSFSQLVSQPVSQLVYNDGSVC